MGTTTTSGSTPSTRPTTGWRWRRPRRAPTSWRRTPTSRTWTSPRAWRAASSSTSSRSFGVPRTCAGGSAGAP
eukprot:2382885-Alexandrium_andersonii.AAC.1